MANEKNLKHFKKGQSGNLNGRPKKLPGIDELLTEVLGEEKNGRTAAKAILQTLTAKAIKGDIRAAEVLLNRGYGFPRQSLQYENKEQVLIRILRDPAA